MLGTLDINIKQTNNAYSIIHSYFEKIIQFYTLSIKEYNSPGSHSIYCKARPDGSNV